MACKRCDKALVENAQLRADLAASRAQVAARAEQDRLQAAARAPLLAEIERLALAALKGD